MSDGAKVLGKRLLGEVEVEGLSEVLRSLRAMRESHSSQRGISNSFSGIPELDALLPNHTPPILELVSPPPAHHPSGAGKTSLLYLIIARAILPPIVSSIQLGGHNAAVILFDPLHHFSIPRLVEVMFTLLTSDLQTGNKPVNESAKTGMKHHVKQSLTHLHVFRPQSWPVCLATLRSLPDYLFDKDRHESIHRHVHSIILEDIETFVYPIRYTSNSIDIAATSPNPLSVASTHLTTILQSLSTLLSCTAILSSHSTSLTTFRPPFPSFWPQGTIVTRLAVRRAEVLKFTPAISVEEAEVERAQRWNVVRRGRFECWKVGTGGKDGDGFIFRVGKGVEVERGGS